MLGNKGDFDSAVRSAGCSPPPRLATRLQQVNQRRYRRQAFLIGLARRFRAARLWLQSQKSVRQVSNPST
jgi:hypothetical protein